MSGDHIVIDERKFLRIGGIPICRVTPGGNLEFKDKDGYRSRQRGSAFVTVTLEQIARAIMPVPMMAYAPENIETEVIPVMKESAAPSAQAAQ